MKLREGYRSRYSITFRFNDVFVQLLLFLRGRIMFSQHPCFFNNGRFFFWESTRKICYEIDMVVVKIFNLINKITWNQKFHYTDCNPDGLFLYTVDFNLWIQHSILYFSLKHNHKYCYRLLNGKIFLIKIYLLFFIHVCVRLVTLRRSDKIRKTNEKEQKKV